MKTALKQPKVRLTRALTAFVFAFSAVTSSFVVYSDAHAASMNQVFVRFDRMQTSQNTTATVCAQTAAASSTEASVRVTIPTGYTVSSTAADHDVSTVVTTSWPAGAVVWPGIGTEATAVAGQEITVASTALNNTSLYCFNFTNASAITTSGSVSSSHTGTVATYDSGPTLIDSSDYTTATISDDTIDVTATVPQTFSFTIDNTADALGAQSTGAVDVSTTPRVVTVNTNAQNGWFVWASEGGSAGMHSSTASYSIDTASPGSATSLSAGTEGYITGVTDAQVDGSGTITLGAYDYDTGTDGASLDGTPRIIASSDGTAEDATLTIRNQLAISALTPAATDYTDSITFVGAGNF